MPDPSLNNRHERVLVVDCGTQSIRAATFCRDGTRAGFRRVAMQQDAPCTAKALYQSVERAIRDSAVASDGAQIQALAITGQRASTVVVPNPADNSQSATLLRWTDAEQASATPSLPWWLRTGAAVAGSADLLAELQRRAPINRFCSEHPIQGRRARGFMTVQGWLAWQCTGRFRDATSAQIGYWPFDHESARWQRNWHWQWHALAVRRGQLPELDAPGMSLGPLQPNVAERLGLPVGIPVVACGTDKGCEHLASGAADNDSVLSFGSAATVTRHLSSFGHVQPLRPAYLSADGRGWDAEVQLDEGFRLIAGFIRQELRRDPGAALDLSRLDAALDAHQPGYDDLAYLPFSRRNVTFPSRRASGGWTDPARAASADVSSRYHALLEGILMALRFGNEHLAKRFSTEQALWATGGGASSQPVQRLAASVFGTRLSVPADTESSLRGAAMTAAVGAGWWPDFASALQHMGCSSRNTGPDPQAARIYEWRYRNLFRPLLERSP